MMKRLAILFVLVFLFTLLYTPPIFSQQGAGPFCDLQFLRNARRNGRVCLCFQRVNGARQMACFQVFRGMTPAQMATALANVINLPQSGLTATNPGASIVCITAVAGTSRIKLWTTVSRDGTGGLLGNIGPGPTDPLNASAPPPPAAENYQRYPPVLEISGTPNSQAHFMLNAGGCILELPIEAGTSPELAAGQLVDAINEQGCRATFLGVDTSALGDILVPKIELTAGLNNSPIEKIFELGYDEANETISNLGFSAELMEDLITQEDYIVLDVISSSCHDYQEGNLTFAGTLGEWATETLEHNNTFLCQGFHQGGPTIVSSNILSTEQSEANIQVFPNPTNAVVHIRSDYSAAMQVELVDLSGKVLIRSELPPFADQEILNLQQFPTALYVLRLLDKRNRLLAIFKVQKI